MRVEVAADPFGELAPARYRVRHAVLGADFQIESNSRELLRLVDAAFGGLKPRHAAGARHTLRLHLQDVPVGSRDSNPPLGLLAGAGLLAAATRSSACVTLSPATRAGLVIVPRAMLEQPRILRYELIELAALTLATRTQGLGPLHAACVAANGRAALLLGASGTGKSTFCLHWILSGRQMLAEDSTFVVPRTLEARGVAAYLHLRAEALRFAPPRAAAAIRRSAVIRRRSGVEKFEFDLRERGRASARGALPLACVVRLSRQRARAGQLLTSMKAGELRAHLGESQAYAARQPGWRDFLARLARLPMVDLRRGAHPDDGVAALGRLLAGSE